MINGKVLSGLGIDPYLLALAGMVALGALAPARGAGAEAMSFAVCGAVSLLFFLYGARLSPQAVVEGLLHWRLQSIVFCSTFGLFPAVGLSATSIFRPWLPGDLAVGLLFLCLLPSTIQSSIAFTSIARGNVPAAICSASASNLVGIFVTPVLVALLMRSQGAGFSLKALEDVAAQLLLPFAAGQLARPLIGRWISGHRRLTGFVDRGSILLIVYAAFSEGMVAGVWSQIGWRSVALILALDLAILSIVLVVTTWASRRLGFSKEDEIAIVFCVRKRAWRAASRWRTSCFPVKRWGLSSFP